jgi:hypothetical protein
MTRLRADSATSIPVLVLLLEDVHLLPAAHEGKVPSRLAVVDTTVVCVESTHFRHGFFVAEERGCGEVVCSKEAASMRRSAC